MRQHESHVWINGSFTEVRPSNKPLSTFDVYFVVGLVACGYALLLYTLLSVGCYVGGCL